MLNVLDNSQFQQPKVYVEGTWLYGAIATGVLYGMVIILYVMCARSLWGHIHSHDGTSRKHWFFFVYINFIFALSTLYVASNSRITQLGFINHRDYPGGPGDYEINTASAPVNIAFVVSNWCADALMIWRCAVVYKDCKFHLIVTLFGCLLLLASIVTGSVWVVIVSQPEQSTKSWMSPTLLLPYLCVGLAINISISTLTVFRLMYYRARISKILGPGYGMFYTSFAAIIVESAAIYSISSLLFLLPYIFGSPLANAFMQILGEAQIVAPLLIILRISEGKAWTRETATCLSTCDAPIGHQLSSLPNSTSSRPTRLNIQVNLERVQHTDREGSIPGGDRKRLAS